jgi:hypothetical protein
VFFGSILKLAYWHIARQLKDRYNPKKRRKDRYQRKVYLFKSTSSQASRNSLGYRVNDKYFSVAMVHYIGHWIDFWALTIEATPKKWPAAWEHKYKVKWKRRYLTDQKIGLRPTASQQVM